MSRLIVLAPSAGGKSTIMRYLRAHTAAVVRETDEEVMKANNNVWPDDNKYKDEVLLPKVLNDIITNNEDVIFLASFIPTELLLKAREEGFRVVLLDLKFSELQKRNKKRMAEEGYQDATPWQQMQLDNYAKLRSENLIDEIVDGTLSVEKITDRLNS